MLDKLNLALKSKSDLNDSFFLLYGDITTDSAQNTTEWILGNNFSAEPPDMLTMLINSAGGDLAAAWAIIDIMKGSTIPIRIIGLGQIASAGLLIFMSGTKGSRVLTENTSIMSHQYLWGVVGKHHELMAIQKEYNFTQERLLKHFRKCTGLTTEEIEEYLMPPHDVYLSATEALDLGLCDIVKSLK